MSGFVSAQSSRIGTLHFNLFAAEPAKRIFTTIVAAMQGL